MTRPDPNSKEVNDRNFQPGGAFDKANGSRQTRLFAEAFHRHSKVPLEPNFSVLDAGCALGDALPVWRNFYPQARLYGCDFSPTAIQRCEDVHGDISEFYCSRLEDISDFYDIIYCSNVLEHFSNYLEIARFLIIKCKILYIMVPYKEFLNGKPLGPDNDYYHKATFYLSSFDALASPGICTVSAQVIRAPGAWSPTLLGEARWFVRRYVARRPGLPPRQAIFEIRSV